MSIEIKKDTFETQGDLFFFNSLQGEFWHGEKREDIAFYTSYWSDDRCCYWGNIYNKDKKCIGDYNAKDSTDIEKCFASETPARDFLMETVFNIAGSEDCEE